MEVTKAMPVIIKSHDKEKLKDLMNIIRRLLPKSFFKVIQGLSKNKNRSMIAICFQAKVQDNRVQEEESIEAYLQELYQDQAQEEGTEIPPGDHVEIKLSHLHNARAKLSRNKAPGTDGMKDAYIKSKKIFQEVKYKYQEHFQAWFDDEELPQAMRIGKIFLLSKDEGT